MRKTKKRLSAALLVLTLVCAMAVSLAYFTDREEASVTATAGTLNLELTQNWAGENPNSAETKPGDIYTLDYTLKNNGNKSADVRETFVITSDVALSSTAPAQFEIYAAADVEVVNGFHTPKAGAQPLSVRSTSSYQADLKDADGNYYAEGDTKDGVNETYYTITYAIPEYILNGSGANAETESGISTDTKTGEYVVLFAKEATSEFQGAHITIDYMAEAKQHRNTDASIWGTVASESITFAGSSVNAVPEA